MIPWTKIWTVFNGYGIVGILAFLFIAIAVYKIMKNDDGVGGRIKTYFVNRSDRKNEAEDKVMRELKDINEKIGILNQIATKTNENINQAVRDIADRLQDTLDLITDCKILIENLDTSSEDKDRLISVLQQIEDRIRKDDSL